MAAYKCRQFRPAKGGESLPLNKAQKSANKYALGIAENFSLADVVQSMQNGQVGGQNGVPDYQGFAPGAVDAALRIGTVTGDVVTAGTAVSTGAVGAGITPIANAWWVASGPVGAAIASYSGGADGTFSVNASAAGTVTVAFLY